MNIIVLEETGKRVVRLAARLREAGCHVVGCLTDVTALERALDACEAEWIVLDFEDPDPDLVAGVARLGQARGKPTVAFVERADPETLAAAFRAGLSGFVVRGSEIDRLRDELVVAKARFLADRDLRGELRAARTSLSERKVIERAKGRLMQIEGLDEPSAYRMLRDLALHRNRRVVDVAEAILEHIEV
jgi:response regulator NasT